MINQILHLVTNRATFASALFPDNPDFLPGKLTADATAVHRLLRLDVTTNDYYVVGAMAALYSFPELIEALPAETRTFALADFQRPRDSILGATPIPDHSGPFVMRRHAAEFPVLTSVRLTYVEAGYVRISLGSSAQVVPITAQGALLYPQWPAELGISGGLQLVGQAWDADCVVVITHIPVTFPYDVVAEMLRVNNPKNSLLLQFGLLEHYFIATTPMEKVATVLTALALSNPA